MEWLDFLPIIQWLDLITAILGLAYILLEYKASKWMWAVGFVMQVLGIVLYYNKGIYADCAMEFYYLALTVYGFLHWSKGSPTTQKAEPLPITHLPLRKGLLMLSAAVILWGGIYWLLTTYTDSTVPLADAFTTAFSLVGIWALAHKHLEQWFVWIAVDVVTCWLYATKDLPFKSALYGLYIAIAIAGYFKWKRMMGYTIANKQ